MASACGVSAHGERPPGRHRLFVSDIPGAGGVEVPALECSRARLGVLHPVLGWADVVFQKIDPTCSIIGSPSLASYASGVVVDPEVVDTAKAAQKRDEVKTAAIVAVRAADYDP